MEGAQVPQQLPEDTGLRCGQPGLELLQDLMGAGLAVHTGLEGNEVPHLHQQVVVLRGAGQWHGHLCQVPIFTLQALGEDQVVSRSHPGQEGGGGEGPRGGVRVLCFSTEVLGHSVLSFPFQDTILALFC